MRTGYWILFVVIGLTAGLTMIQCGCGGGSTTPAPAAPGGGGSGGSGGGGGGGGSGGGSGGGGGGAGGGGGSGGTTIPLFSHVLLLVEENHGYSDVIANPNMPYINGLAATNGLATQYFADAHPSLPNYFTLAVGMAITGTTGDGYTGTVTQDNVARAITAAGKTWRYYGEGLPQAGYLGTGAGEYVRKHDPFAYLSDVLNSPAQAGNLVPFTQFSTDLSNGNLPDYGFITPDLNDDAHDCPAGLPTCTDSQKLAAADQWLKTNIDPLIKSAAFQDTLLIITFDEAEDSDTTHGGGHVATFIISPKVKPGYQSTTLYQHESTLRLTMKALGISDFPGAAATAPDMTEFFQ